MDGDTYHGISVFGRGVFTDDENGYTYAGQIRDGHACGLGVATWSDGLKVYAEHGPDGQCDGRYLYRSANGTTGYILYERGEKKEYVHVYINGTCEYNDVACAPDDPRLLALIAQVAPVEVRPKTRAPHPLLAPHSPPSNRPMDQPARFAPAGTGEGHGHRAVHPFSCRRWWLRDIAQQQPHCKARPRSDVCTRPICRRGRTGGTFFTLTTAAWCTRSVHYHAIVLLTAC